MSTIPELMTIFVAARLAKQGYNIRRAVWVESVPEGELVPQTSGKRVSAWLAYAQGVWYYRYRDGEDEWTERVVEATDVTVDDLRATDWTTRDENWQQVPAPIVDQVTVPSDTPTLPALPPPVPVGSGSNGSGSGSSGGGSTGGSSSGGGSGSSSGGGSGDGGGSPGSGSSPTLPGGGSPGGGAPGGPGGPGPGPRPRPRPKRTPPSLTVVVTRMTPSECVPRLSNGAQSQSPVTDQFVIAVTMGADPSAQPGEVWFLTVFCRGRRYSGTIIPGATINTEFTTPGLPAGTVLPVTANAWLPKVGISANGSDKATMRDHCPPGDPVLGCTDPAASNYNSAATQDDDSCTYDPGPVLGCTDPAANNYNPLATVDDASCTYDPGEEPIYGCMNNAALNYNPAATHDNGTCIFECPEGTTWDPGTQACVWPE